MDLKQKEARDEKIAYVKHTLEKLDSLTMLLDTVNRANMPNVVKVITEKCLDLVKTL